VFAHVLLQEVTEGTEKLCWLSFFCSKNSVSNISVNAVDSDTDSCLNIQQPTRAQVPSFFTDFFILLPSYHVVCP
jgi:hypothetical protein